jgi:cytochrome P450
MFEHVYSGYMERLTGDPFPDTRENLRFIRKHRSVKSEIQDIIERRRRNAARPHDFLSMLMSARYADDAPMPDELIVDEIMNQFAAGHVTIASALKSTWYLLSRHPDVLARLRAELDRVLGNEEPDAASPEALHYTRQVIQEAMRLYPPVWAITRTADRDTTIGGHPVPAGSQVFIVPPIVHTHPDFWARPTAFDPDHFAARAVRSRHAHAYMPFALGPRKCIGEHLSMWEMSLHLATTARVLGLEHVAGDISRFEAGFVLRDKRPLEMLPVLR